MDMSALIPAAEHVRISSVEQPNSIGERRNKDDRPGAPTLARLAFADPQLLCPVKHRSAQARSDRNPEASRSGSSLNGTGQYA